MQKENVKICDDFVERVVPLMSYNLFDNEDPRNLIKRCPSCGIIWFKTEGCDGTTTCGNNQFSKPAGVTSKVFWKYYLQRIGGKLQWTKNPIENNVLEENLQASSSISRLFRSMALDTSERRDYANSKRVGCGKEFRWSTLPKIEDELILELFKVKTIDQAKQLIQADNFKEARQNYESTIDSKFHF